MGYTISQALTSGFQRGMFSNEAGMGSTPNAAAAAASWPPHPAAQGIVQMIGVFIDTVVICTASAVIIMLAPRAHGGEDAANGIQAIQHAMSGLVGGWGAGFVAVIVLLFAFSSIVANYIYAENNLIFLRFNSPRCIWALRIITILMVLTGTMMSLPVVWRLAILLWR
ncbi:Na+/alanine symporter [Raoultella terrigena]|uniref:Na+/alanine symporter n=1 Tax=Raoultella terrigena TaxID=577 RepID=A0A3P8M5M2_RAOTE|nr:Na+/alanine symporter [Raoultella terrigena]